MLSFKIDENLPIELASMLSARGHDAVTVNDQRMGGRPDPNIADLCRIEQRALISLDLDFADIRSYPPEKHPGLIVLRLGSQNKNHILAVFERTIDLIGREPIAGRLWIVSEGGVRIHGAED